jgi:hypothetical protein
VAALSSILEALLRYLIITGMDWSYREDILKVSGLAESEVERLVDCR